MANLCRLSVLSCVLAAFAAGTASGQPTEGAAPKASDEHELFTYDDLDKAWQQVQKSHRPLLLFVSMNQCFYCEKMIKETYSHPEIVHGIRELFVTAAVVKEQKPEMIQHLGVRAFPTTLVIAPGGELIARIEGYADPKKFVLTLRPALAAHAEAQRTAAVTNNVSSAPAVQ